MNISVAFLDSCLYNNKSRQDVDVNEIEIKKS